MEPADDLPSRIEEFIARTGMTPTVFGRKAVNDPGCVFWIRKGRRPRPPTRERIKRFIANETMEGAA